MPGPFEVLLHLNSSVYKTREVPLLGALAVLSGTLLTLEMCLCAAFSPGSKLSEGRKCNSLIL